MDKTSIRKQDSLAADASTQPRQFFRASSRLFCLNGEWFFQTRDNDHGPFTKREAAEQALDRYVSEVQDIEQITSGLTHLDSGSYLGRPTHGTQLEFEIL